ncbi:MAG TPA: penicillin acylase family protein [Rhizomicrobium sp.]|nr:penicillin acylase family protein [Rhizomicrobium sp.]
MGHLSARLLGTAALLSFIAVSPVQAAGAADARLKAEAAGITITRDTYGIAHVKGHTDENAVFGMVYAQAEDDFNRVETNYATNLGLTAQNDGEKAIWSDLRQRLFIDPEVLKADYAKSPDYLKKIMTGWADGLNYFLATHPNVKPKYITHYEPWMALSFTEGSIGGDVEKARLSQLQAFYEKRTVALTDREKGFVYVEPVGSNGIAISSKISKDGHAMLWINPHTSFYFRAELGVASDEGLNAFGAATWGQPFLYQGFNEHLGWMHTTSSADSTDEYAETVTQRDGKYFYKYGNQELPVTVKNITINYKAANGSMAKKTFTAYFTKHGPIVREADGKWIALAIMNVPIAALEQSFGRTKAKTMAEYMKVANLGANSSNDTLYADDKGNIALLLPQFVPNRDDKFDYTKPVDGSDPATDWKGNTPMDKIPQVVNPASGWVFNSNDTPQNSAGPNTVDMAKFPKYMDASGENPRGVHMVKVLTGTKAMTQQGLIEAAFDPYQPAFAEMVPQLLKDYDALPASSPLKGKLAEPIATLKGWDYKWGADSVANSVAIFWGEALYNKLIRPMRAAGIREDYVDYLTHKASAEDRLQSLSMAVDQLTADFGSWKTPWGNINRYQRITDDIQAKFDDNAPSQPVPFDSAQWGSIASYGAVHDHTKKWYGVGGNSIIGAINFGPKVQALMATVGGASGDPKSPHFKDQVDAYITGKLIPVYFYPEDYKAHTERAYHPGE